jgi:SAM-dependent methyltransferase
MDERAIVRRLHALKGRLPESMQAEAYRDDDRDVFTYGLLQQAEVVVDLGGGFSPWNPLLAEEGRRVTVVDSFAGYWTSHWSGHEGADVAKLVELLRDAGVRLVEADLVAWEPAEHFAPRSVDVVFSSHTFEHFHSSPLPLLRRCLEVLRDGGRVVICVPNAVNLRKRLAVLVGRTNLPEFDSFFMGEGAYWGHVREYCTDDLRRLAAVLGLEDVRVFGRNWVGRAWVLARAHVPAPLLRCGDWLLSRRAGLCTDLYLEGVVRHRT